MQFMLTYNRQMPHGHCADVTHRLRGEVVLYPSKDCPVLLAIINKICRKWNVANIRVESVQGARDLLAHLIADPRTARDGLRQMRVCDLKFQLKGIPA